MTPVSAEWARPAPSRTQLRTDALIAGTLAVGATTTSLLYARTGIIAEPAPLWVWVLGLALCTLPLALRRLAPIPVAVVVAIGFFVCGQFAVPELLMVNICLFLALYTVGAWERNRVAAVWALIGISAALLAWLVIALIISSSDDEEFLGMPRSGLFSAYATYAVIQIITNLLYFGGAFWFGYRAWRAARTQAMLEAQGQELELERQTSAAQAVALERLGIARELHDVVAHHVSVMGIQAAAARRSLHPDPDRAVTALGVVEGSAHTAVEELRRLVHTLRTPEVEDGSTTVGIAQLAHLVAESQSAGTGTVLIVAGARRPVPLLVDVALYRVVQEALTNVRKHAGRGAEATVRLRFDHDAVEVEISDDGIVQRLASGGAGGFGGAGGSGGSGLGLRGMRERVGAVGGEVWAGRRERGGFMVRARVPLSSEPGGTA
ncbi:sensor histidine kinase [Leucobacter luti]|uniref:histidine kinase n=1 Tax=Leucobacter luti TaxID=340320 RepID=A0A4Q7U1T2_9MICO|nr:histidine kinase [Leucobacter luti]MBL3699298.1 sensor histidine kinase [Leucobacter luti]RZT66807.1 signal transduction histidine kinase [Leucobacter luti]